MGQRQLHRLSKRTVATQKRLGLYGDDGGLYLEIAPGGTKAWIFRFRSPLTTKTRYMRLGAVHKLICMDKTLTLKEAQEAIKTDWIAAYKKYVGERKPFKPQVRCKP